MFRSIVCAAALASCAALACFPAFAHAKLEPGEAASGSTYRGVVRIGHGCEGTATLKVRLLIPNGVVAATPPAKDGWVVESVRAQRGNAAGQHNAHQAGQAAGPDIVEIVWTGRLPDKEKGEFAFTATLPDVAGGHGIAFPIVQECETGEHRWVEVAAHGQSHKDLKSPAPVLKLTPAGATPAVAAAPKYHVHIHGENAMADVVLEPTIGAGRLTVVPMTLDFGALDAREITVSFTQPGAATVERAVVQTADGPWATEGFALPRPGRWSVTLTITLRYGQTVTLRDMLDVPVPAS